MSDKNLGWKLASVVLIAGSAFWMLWPPEERLKLGIDLAGGYSLLYEIDTAGLQDSQKSGLAERVMTVLKERVDPKGQRNLVWRPIGNNRLEVRMPAPPKEARERRAVLDEARDALKATNVSRNDLASALSLEGLARVDALISLERGIGARAGLLTELSDTYEARVAASGADDIAAATSANEQYDSAVGALLATNVDLAVFGDILDMGTHEQAKQRLDRFMLKYPDRTEMLKSMETTYRSWVEFKGSLEGPADLERLLRGAGVLEYRILAKRDASTELTIAAEEQYLRQPIAQYMDGLRQRGPRLRSGDRYQWFEIGNPVDMFNLRDPNELENFDTFKNNLGMIVERFGDKYYVLAHTDSKMVMLHEPGKKNWELKSALPDRDPQTNRPAIRFQLDAPGGAMFYQLSERNIGELLCILLDDVVVSAPRLQSAIREVGQITGDFTQQQVRELVNKLEAGALPARLKPNPIAVKSIGPSLGASNREKGFRAAVWGLGLVLVFMAIYYMVGGFIANFAVLFNLLVTLGLMSWLEATLTLPGIAGLILTVGMAVDANVLIFERMREEKAKGQSLRMVIKNGYDRAFSTIFDANVTTLITCVILGYVGSEEVKGFALTLGFGVATSMFSALFVTRIIFQTLVKYKVIKTVPMLHIPGLANANFNWMKMWKGFWPVSAVLVIAGVVAFDSQSSSSVYDIEFLGGTSAQIELKDGVKMSDEEVRGALADSESGVAAWLTAQAEALATANVEPLGATRFRITSDAIRPSHLTTYAKLTFDDSLHLLIGRGSLETTDRGVEFDSADEVEVNEESIRAALDRNAAYLHDSAGKLAASRVQVVAEIGTVDQQRDTFEIVTLETDKKLVRAAIEHALGDQLNVEQSIGYRVRRDSERAPDGTFPISEESQLLSDVVGLPSAYDLAPFRGGVALVLEELDPPQTLSVMRSRLRDMRLQPDYEQYQWRDFDVVGLEAAGSNERGVPTFSRLAVVVADENFLYDEDPVNWREMLAAPELALAEAALSTEKSLKKVLQFAPSVARQAQNQAAVALILAIVGIMAYLWFRFGSLQYGLAAVIALIHDSAIAVGMVACSHFIAKTAFGSWLLIDDFRIDMTIIAAFLTVLGYSINDTIVIFDRIRENRGKLTSLSANVINNSINQTLSRTILTSGTTLMVVLVMYLFGGAGIHGFSYVLLAGILVGTYSSVAIAAPLLMYPHLMRIALYGIAGMLLIGLCLGIEATGLKTGLIVGIVVLAGLLMIRERLNWDRPIVTAT